MRSDKEKALKYRLQGKSYNEINQLLGVPKSTLSDWFNGLVLSSSAQARINERVRAGSLKGLIKKNKLQTRTAIQQAASQRLYAQKEIGLLSKRDLLISGVALYWAEGYKRPIMKNGKARTYHPVSLTNSDPELIKIFLNFLRSVCEVKQEKIIACLRLFEHQNEKKLIDFWNEVTKIPANNFRKSYYGISKSSLGKRPFNTLPYGTLQISVYDTKLYHRIMGWIEGMK